MTTASPASDLTSTAAPSRVPFLDRHPWHMFRLDPAGFGIGLGFALVSLTPSLLPRTYLFQGLATGVSAAIGYAIGVVLTWLIRSTDRFDHASERYQRVAPGWVPGAAWYSLLGGGAAALLVMLVAGAAWQRRIATVMGMPEPTTDGWLRVGPVALAVFGLLLAAARLMRLEATILARLLRRWAHLPRLLASLVAVTAVVVIAAVLLQTVVLRNALSLADEAFSDLNDRSYPGVVAPASPARSGSPASLVPWPTIGREGQHFVAGGRPWSQLAAASGHAPLDPIRVYIGLETAAEPERRAALAVAELERTGAFDREVLAVVTTTGTGWVDAPVADDLELVHGGDTAIVATQYSYLPSWLSFLFDRPRAAAEGRALFDAVHARVEAMPPERRPRLIAFGESLGSQGSEAAFTDVADARASTDGVLWVGPPNSNRIWTSETARRDPGTPQVLPVVDGGAHVRFASRSEDLAQPPAPWAPPRVVWLQHPTDPVVWWSPSLLWERPPWLSEPRGADVLDAMNWYPFVTFWQVTIDLTNAVGVPDGHGHTYGRTMLDAWLAVAPPAGWTMADTERARGIVGA